MFGVSPETKMNVAKEEGDIHWSGMISKHVCDEHGYGDENVVVVREKNLVNDAILHYLKKVVLLIQIYVALFSKKIIV